MFYRAFRVLEHLNRTQNRTPEQNAEQHMQDEPNSISNTNQCSALVECPTCGAPGLLDEGNPATLVRCFTCGHYFVAWASLDLRTAVFGIEAYPADAERSQFIVGLIGNGLQPTDAQFLWCMVSDGK